MRTPTTHVYEVALTWTGNQGTGTSGYRAYGRDHELTVPGRPPLPGSADPAFRGTPERWNPEQLLVGALAQCHMLWYLHLCSDEGVIVTAYTDIPTGVLSHAPDGSGQFTEVRLRPTVTVSSPDMVAPATALHERASALCFIARSVNFPVAHEPTIQVGRPAGVSG